MVGDRAPRPGSSRCPSSGAGHRQRLGARGEQAVAEWYVARGYRVVARNWRCREGEIDLVVWSRRRDLVFCEVKTRSSTRFGLPAEAVTPAKQQRLRVLATRFLADHDTQVAGRRGAALRRGLGDRGSRGDHRGRVLTRREDWIDGRPPPEAYGRVTNPGRFAVLHAAADALAADLAAQFVVTTAADVEVPSDLADRFPDVRRTLRLDPGTQGAPMTFVFTGFPGLAVRYGRWCTSVLPMCGCDACDDDPSDLVAQLTDRVWSVAARGSTRAVPSGAAGSRTRSDSRPRARRGGPPSMTTQSVDASRRPGPGRSTGRRGGRGRRPEDSAASGEDGPGHERRAHEEGADHHGDVGGGAAVLAERVEAHVVSIVPRP